MITASTGKGATAVNISGSRKESTEELCTIISTMYQSARETGLTEEAAIELFSTLAAVAMYDGEERYKAQKEEVSNG